MSKKNRSPWKSQASISTALQNPARPAHDAPASMCEQADSPGFSTITPAQLLANKANAQLSTGPRTAEGLAKSSLNAVKTALTGRTVLLPTDDANEYSQFVAGFIKDLQPAGTAECELVQNIADAFWRLRRIRALEFAVYAHGHAQFKDEFNDYPEDVRPHMIALQTDMVYDKQLRNYHRQEARIDRQRNKDMAELRRLQQERSSGASIEEEPELDLSPEQIQEIFKNREAVLQSLRPENGFVLSNGENAIDSEPAQDEDLAA